MTYDPFNKSIVETFTVDDLEKLIENNVTEGYFIEYKSKFVKNDKIGRSISSFANTYGGWYIVGVETDEHNVAKNICGFELSDVPDPTSKVCEVIKSNISPQPVFYPQVVKLSEEKAVFVVFIPDEQDKPFICKDGRIYRRVSDSSDPILETNRYAVDKLYEEGKELRQKYKEFCQDERVHNSENAWIEIYISPYPKGIFKNNSRSVVYTQEYLNKIIELSQKQIAFEEQLFNGNIPFNFAQTSFESCILRQNNGDLFNNGLELELFANF